MAIPLIIFGTREIAALARYYFENDSDYRVEAFTADDGHVSEDSFEGRPVIPLSEVCRRYPPGSMDMHVALSYNRLNRLRQEKYEQARSTGYRLVSFVCSRSVYWPDLTHGDNCFILENQTIQPTVRIGNNVMIWSGNHLGHGTVIEDHVYIASHVCISGHCTIGQRSFFGVNATVKDFTSIGSDVFVAMGASVTRDIPAGAVVIGTPGQVLTAENEVAAKLKKKYFKL